MVSCLGSFCRHADHSFILIVKLSVFMTQGSIQFFKKIFVDKIFVDKIFLHEYPRATKQRFSAHTLGCILLQQVVATDQGHDGVRHVCQLLKTTIMTITVCTCCSGEHSSHTEWGTSQHRQDREGVAATVSFAVYPKLCLVGFLCWSKAKTQELQSQGI